MDELSAIPACGQILMLPHASPGFNAWGVFIDGEWVQIGGTAVDLSTNDSLAQLASQGVCAPNSEPVDLKPAEPESHENITNAASPVTTSSGTSQGLLSTQNILGVGVILLVLVGAWFSLRPRKHRVTKFTGSSSGAVDRLSNLTREDNDV